MFGQILIGFSQPFFLSIPTRYSDMWFSGQAHTTVTAVASLANPLGGALGELIDPIWAPISSQIPDMVLYVSIIVCLIFRSSGPGNLGLSSCFSLAYT